MPTSPMRAVTAPREATYTQVGQLHVSSLGRPPLVHVQQGYGTTWTAPIPPSRPWPRRHHASNTYGAQRQYMTDVNDQGHTPTSGLASTAPQPPIASAKPHPAGALAEMAGAPCAGDLPQEVPYGPEPVAALGAARAQAWRADPRLVVLTGVPASAFGNGFVSDDRSSIVAGRAIGSASQSAATVPARLHVELVGDAFARASAVRTYRPLPAQAFSSSTRSTVSTRAGTTPSVLLHSSTCSWFGSGPPPGVARGGRRFRGRLVCTHPAFCEAVHWINGRSDPMTMVFILAGLHLWFRGFEGVKPGWLRVAGICVLTFCASLCKETAFVLRRRGSARAVAAQGSAASDMAGRVLALGAPWIADSRSGWLRDARPGPTATGSARRLATLSREIPLLWARRTGLAVAALGRHSAPVSSPAIAKPAHCRLCSPLGWRSRLCLPG